MTHAHETLQQILKTKGYSLTKARLHVFDALVGQEPMAMYELVARASEVDRASVYRAIDLFERVGVVQRLNTGWKYKLELSDTFTDHHHHLTCIKCGRTIPINEHTLEELLDKVAAAHSFKPHAHQIEIQGLCKRCQA